MTELNAQARSSGACYQTVVDELPCYWPSLVRAPIQGYYLDTSGGMRAVGLAMVQATSLTHRGGRKIGPKFDSRYRLRVCSKASSPRSTNEPYSHPASDRAASVMALQDQNQFCHPRSFFPWLAVGAQ